MCVTFDLYPLLILTSYGVCEAGWDNTLISSIICSAFFLPHVHCSRSRSVLVGLICSIFCNRLYGKDIHYAWSLIVFRPDCIFKNGGMSRWKSCKKSVKRSLKSHTYLLFIYLDFWEGRRSKKKGIPFSFFLFLAWMQ